MIYNNIAKMLVSIIHENDLESSKSENDIARLLESIVESKIPENCDIEDQIYCITNEMLDIDVSGLQLFVGIFTNNYNDNPEQFKSYLQKFEEKVENLIKDLKKEKMNTQENSELKVYTIGRTFEGSLLINSYLQRKGNKIAKKFKIKPFDNILNVTTEFKSIPFDDSETKDFKIRIDSRIEANKIDLDSSLMNGYVFTANIFDITHMLDTIGNKLFDGNLRIGIDDKNDVDKSIMDTLSKSHKEFWYLNNGITLITRKNHLNLNDPNHLILNYSSDNKFSIVNGAQTVTSTLKFFVKPKISSLINEPVIINQEKIEDVKNETKVLLRVIEVSDDEYKNSVIPSDKNNPVSITNQDEHSIESTFNEKQSDFNDVNTTDSINKTSKFSKVSKISIALNRQKPINDDDIAYVIRFIEVINNLREDNVDISPFTFSIIRRGEGQNLSNNSYELMTFARITKAYLAISPGDARSSSRSTLLKIARDENTGDISFKDDKVFKGKDCYLYGEYDKYEDIFKKYYKPVNYAVSLKYQMDRLNLTNITKSIDYENIFLIQEQIKSQLENDPTKYSFSESYQISNIESLPIENFKDLDFLKESFKNTLSYGKYHLVTFIIHHLSNHSNIDQNQTFENWPHEKYTKDKNLELFFALFSISWRYASILKDKDTNIDLKKFESTELDKSFSSNDFKLSTTGRGKNTEKFQIAYLIFKDLIETIFTRTSRTLSK